MGNANIGCTPTLAQPQYCAPSLKKHEECFGNFDPCTPALAGRNIEPLNDQECADIALVQATIRGEVADVERALASGASVNTIAELTLRMGEPSKKGRRGQAVHLTPLMRACELGHEDIVVQLLMARASTLQCDSHGWTPVCHALAAGEVSIAHTLSRSPGFRAQQQKAICRKLQSEIVKKCQKDCSEETLASLKKWLVDLGLETGKVDIIKDRPCGADPDKVHPLYDENLEQVSDFQTDLWEEVPQLPLKQASPADVKDLLSGDPYRETEIGEA